MRFVDANKFLGYLNSKHKNISFTVEVENDNKLPFLDILVTKDNGSLDTTVFRKNTVTQYPVTIFTMHVDPVEYKWLILKSA